MSLPASDALDTFSVTRHAADPRADGASRTVRVSATAVTIERSLDGVRMRVGVPVAAYNRARHRRAGAGRPRHAEPAPRRQRPRRGVRQRRGRGGRPATARAWSHVLGKTIAVEEACVAMGGAQGRRHKRIKPGRRSAFSRRRKPGVAARAARSFAAEHEIIARD